MQVRVLPEEPIPTFLFCPNAFPKTRKFRLLDGYEDIAGEWYTCYKTTELRSDIIFQPDVLSLVLEKTNIKIEGLIHRLKTKYTVVIVTHNMHQAARVSDFTAFMRLGELTEFVKNREDLYESGKQAHRRLRHGQVRMTGVIRPG